MKRLFILIALLTSPNLLNAGVLDDFIQQKQEEQKATQAQDNMKADCKQAYDKAFEVRKKLSVSSNDIFIPCTRTPCRDRDWVVKGNKANGENLYSCDCLKVNDFGKGGLLLAKLFGSKNIRFVRTTNTDWYTGATFEEDYVFVRDGNHKYKTASGNMESVPAYRKTEYKASDLTLRTYLKDKSIDCIYMTHIP